MTRGNFKMDNAFEIDETKFADNECLELQKNRKLEKKYNIKINTRDLMLIEELSKQFGCSQSQVINAVLRSWVLREFMNFIENIPDCAAAIALTADNYANLKQDIDVGTCGTNILFQKACNITGQGKNFFSELVFEGPYYSEWAQYSEKKFKERYSDKFGSYLNLLISFMETHGMNETNLEKEFKKLLNKINTNTHTGE